MTATKRSNIGRPRDKITNDLTTTALDYAARHWPVFPLSPGTKRPAIPKHSADACDHTDPKCSPEHTGWEARATTNNERIIQAWGHRAWGIGIACGPSGLIVVDLDIAKNGQPSGAQTLCDLESEHGQTLPETWTVATPSGGWHLYYTQPSGQPLRNSNGKIGPGIDTRGWGGYVVAPPTRLQHRQNQTAGVYQTVKPLDPIPLPQWFSQLLATHPSREAEPSGRQLTISDRQPSAQSAAIERYVTAAIAHQLDHLTGATAGNRNQTLFHTAVALGQLVGTGVATEPDITHQINNVIGTHVADGAYTWAQAQRTITSGIARGAKQPRSLPANLYQPTERQQSQWQ